MAPGEFCLSQRQSSKGLVLPDVLRWHYLTHKDIHEARIIRDAEAADPGIVRRALDEKLEQCLRQAIMLSSKPVMNG
jgi:hypothetical protein